MVGFLVYKGIQIHKRKKTDEDTIRTGGGSGSEGGIGPDETDEDSTKE